MEFWSKHKLETERKRFVAARKDHVSWTGLAAVFLVTFFATWAASTALFHWTTLRMPVRYVLAMVVGYGVFFLVVRVWSDFQKRAPQYRPRDNDDVATLELMQFDNGSGFFLVIIGLPLALIFGALVSWIGAAMLLEVAFEVAFAGVMVRSVWKTDHTVGNWQGALLRKTWLWAALAMLLVYQGAHFLQSRFPSLQTAADVVVELWWHY